jgi:hypothetical protein
MSGFQASRTVPTNPRSARGKYCAGGGELLGVGVAGCGSCWVWGTARARHAPPLQANQAGHTLRRLRRPGINRWTYHSRSDLRPSLSVRWPSPDWGSLLRWYVKGNAHLRLVGGTAHRDGSGASVLSDRVTQAPSVDAAGRGRPPQAAPRRAGLEGVEKSLPAPSTARTRRSGTPACFAHVPHRRIAGRAAY